MRPAPSAGAFALLLVACAPLPQGTALGAGLATETTGTVIYAVGDIAQCGIGPPAGLGAARTAALLRATSGPILLLGDLAYPDGSTADFRDCFAPTWGDLKARLWPIPGNHEYKTAGAGPYFAWFGDAAAPPHGYYSRQLGGWHIVALNSNIDTRPGSAQERWLREVLSASLAKCTLVYWHHPLFTSSPRGNNPKMRDIWQLLHAYGADVVVSAHEHVYERFAPQSPHGAADPTRGIRQFVVGTGGARSGSFDQAQPNSEARQRGVFGVLQLTLREDDYTWKFLPVAGQKFHESGDGRCHQ